MIAPTAAPEDKIRIFNREGFPLAEFSTGVQRSWAIGEVGRAQFSWPSRKTNVANEDVVQFGNWLLVENSILPPWIGIIEPQRRFSSQSLTVQAFSAERIFNHRRGPLQIVIKDSPGGIFTQMLGMVNAAEKTVISAGNIWTGGKEKTVTLNPKKLDVYLTDLSKTIAEEFIFRPAVEDGKLRIYADWVQRIGQVTDEILHAGRLGGNVEAQDSLLTEDGPIVNDLLAYGDGATWTSKPNVTVTDPASIAKYGLYQDSMQYTGADLETLLLYATNSIARTKSTTKLFSLNALNIGNTWRSIALGNTLTFRGEKVGFSDGNTGTQCLIRIIGMGYDPEESIRKVQLVVKKYG